MLRTVYKSVVLTGLLALLLSGIYPLVVWALGTAMFPSQTEGGLLEQHGRVLGSRLIGQRFTRPEYLHGRPSAAGDKGYDATSSSGSNLGPTSQKLSQTVDANVKAALQENPGLQKGKVPTDLVTASGSGLDPHVSPDAADVQVARIAGARHLSTEQVREVIAHHQTGRQLGFLGEPVVNVLETNVELDARYPISKGQ